MKGDGLKRNERRLRGRRTAAKQSVLLLMLTVGCEGDIHGGETARCFTCCMDKRVEDKG